MKETSGRMLNDSAPPPKYAMSLSKALFSASTLLGRVLRARVMASPAESDFNTSAELAKKHSPEEIAKREKWKSQQEELKLRLMEVDSEEVLQWGSAEGMFSQLHHVAGVDISFMKESPNQACAMISILNFPQLEVVHTSCAAVEMTEPYIPGFLAFREVGFLLDRLEEVRQNHPQFTPQVILVDGNGILHPRGFGIASHLGVLSGIPSIGVGKKLFHVDGIEQSPQHKQKIVDLLHKKGDYFSLEGTSGRVWGAALKTSDEASNPVYVSVGQKISLETAVKLVISCSMKRVPEPIRQADIQSREYLRTK